MCCRYYFDDIVMADVARLTENAVGTYFSGNQLDTNDLISRKFTGDIHPADSAIILSGSRFSLQAEVMGWGFPSYNQLLINARAESALQKPTFSESVMRRRCIIPARHFYEWDSKKNKVTFSLFESPVMYMAGFYNVVNNEKRFIILTTGANESMEKVHDRMPLILPEKQVRDWIFDDEMVRDILAQESPILKAEQKYEQLTLW